MTATATRRRWGREAIIAAMRRWNELHGRPPVARDWNPGAARAGGRDDLAERFEREGCWPHLTTVRDTFGTWNAALQAAGLPTRGVGSRGPEVPPAAPTSQEGAGAIDPLRPLP